MQRWMIPMSLCLSSIAIPQDESLVPRARTLALLAKLEPGDRLQLPAGRYEGGIVTQLRGTAKAPIVVEAKDPEHPPVFVGGQSGLQLTRAAHVVLRGLHFEGATGNGLNIDDGGARDGKSGHLRLEKLVVRDVGPRGNRDGIKLSGIEHFVLIGCRVERWGSGGSAIDMVGCHDGEIRDCTFRHRLGQGGSGVQAKGGSRAVKVIGCYFEHAGQRAVNLGGSTGLPYFRPPDAKFEAKDLLVERCTFVGSDAPVAFVGVDAGIVRHCLIYRPRRWVVRILQESRDERFVRCRNGVFEKNVIVWRRDELRAHVNVGPGTEPQSFRFEANWWFCEDAPDRSEPRLPVEEQRAVHGKDPKLLLDPGKPPRLAKDSPVRR